ncbi:hypothetical protein GCM10023080_071960 [Streptomyces pseudoechinosporeus]
MDATVMVEFTEDEQSFHSLLKSGLEQIGTLTARERDVLLLMYDGVTNLEVATALSITERTVRFHVDSIRRKLGGVSRFQLCLISYLHCSGLG